MTDASNLSLKEQSLVVATRIHLGNASAPPSQESLENTVTSFLSLSHSCGASRAAIAVDGAVKIKGYDLPSALRLASEKVCKNISTPIDVITVQPWGKFIPALNALVAWGLRSNGIRLLLISAETHLSAESISYLCGHVCSNTLVAGAVLPGHDYHGWDEKEMKVVENTVDLNGRTTPWNTAAVWNLPKIGLLGFPLIADGLHPNLDGGVEEVSTIACLQRILPEGTGKAKLVKVPNVDWQQTWDDDDRKKWHEHKMMSKVARPQKHLELLGLSGTVIHC